MPSMLITGANRGLGLELTRQYVADGWRIYACCRNPGSAGELDALGDQVSVHELDVGKPEQIKALAASFQGTPIDVLFNNAGLLGVDIAAMEPSLFGSIDYDAWTQVLEINTIAPMRVAEAFVDHVAASDRKLMVFMSTNMGSITNLGEGNLYQYRSSKAALNLVVKGLSFDLGERGIRTLALHPGWVSTDMGGPDAPVTPEESIAGIRRVIAGYSADQSGQFYQYDGVELPW